MAYKDKQKQKENKRQYYLANKEIIKERARLWNLEHKDRRSIHGKKYRQQQNEVYQEPTQTNGRELDLPIQAETQE